MLMTQSGNVGQWNNLRVIDSLLPTFTTASGNQWTLYEISATWKNSGTMDVRHGSYGRYRLLAR
jgi:hypothetical protein